MDHIIDISICVDNDAFGDTYDEQAAEVARILKGLADLLEVNSDYLDPSYGYFPTLRDRNGNRVGSFKTSVLPIS